MKGNEKITFETLKSMISRVFNKNSPPIRISIAPNVTRLSTPVFAILFSLVLLVVNLFNYYNNRKEKSAE
jgi:hypothetical protein